MHRTPRTPVNFPGSCFLLRERGRQTTNVLFETVNGVGDFHSFGVHRRRLVRLVRGALVAEDHVRVEMDAFHF